jgi:hypothetical protein
MSQRFVNVAPIFQPVEWGWNRPLGLKDFTSEPSLLSCSVEGVKHMGGPLANLALGRITSEYRFDIENAQKHGLSACVDTRVQRLMPGQYPSIPGWHCDGVPRSLVSGQPNFSSIDPHSFHVCVLFSSEVGGISQTEYVVAPFHMNVWDDEHVYKDMHKQVERVHPEAVLVKDGVLARFTCKTLHRTSPCHKRGWRMFFRFSMLPNPHIWNGVPKQQQVYQLSEENGW